MSSLFDVGLSALDASQSVLNLIGNNLANANTPGYHRQVADLTEADPTQIGNVSVGSGVQISDTRRQIDNLLETALTNQTFALADTSAQLSTVQQVQTDLNPSSGSIQDQIEQFFNDVNTLATQPSDTTQRTVVVNDAHNLADAFNSLSSSLDQIQSGLDTQLNSSVSDINSLAKRIAQLNDKIQRAYGNGNPPNDLLDQRDQLVNQLAGDINVQAIPANLNQVNILAGGVPIVIGNQSQSLQYSIASGNQGQVSVAGSSTPMSVTGGQAGVNAMTGVFYPTDLRSTGLGAGLGVGRIGSIVGPEVAGDLLGRHWSNQQLFYAAAVPALTASLIMIALKWVLNPASSSAAVPIAERQTTEPV